MIAALGFIPSWAWRWIAIFAVAAAAGWACYLKGEAHVQEQFDQFEAAVKAAGDKQNQLTQATIKAHQQLKELSDAEAKTREADLTAELAATRVRLDAARSSTSILPKSSPGADGNKRICAARDVFDRGYAEISGRLQERALAIAGKGQRGIDLTVICKAWGVGLQIVQP